MNQIVYNNYEFVMPIVYNKYISVMKELKKLYCHPRCTDSCKYIAKFANGGLFIRNPILIRQFYKYCTICNEHKVSESDHSICHMCARKSHPIEFTYHHEICISNL